MVGFLYFDDEMMVNVQITYRADRDELVGVIHHGDEKIEQDDDVDDREASEHDETPEPGELFYSSQLKVVQVYQTKSCPEQSLCCLPETNNPKL